MMMHAYSESYLDDAMQNMGDMMEYALCDCGYDPDEFFGYFLTSGIAAKFENGNPKYVVGMSGVELTETVLRECNVQHRSVNASHPDYKGKEYWAGWILAYYQWYTSKRFADIVSGGLTLSTILDMYILHEADESKFIESADAILERNSSRHKSKLQIIRKARGFTQQQLSEASGVTLRMVQLYEQKQNDLSKAQVNVAIGLAKALGCSIEDIID